MGQHLGGGETFTVLDLFEGAAADDENAAEHASSYSTLTRQQFERNYLTFHDALPVVVQDRSSAITDHVPVGSVRFDARAAGPVGPAGLDLDHG